MQNLTFVMVVVLTTLLGSCSTASEEYVIFEGQFTGKAALSLKGQEEQLPIILKEMNVDVARFQKMLTDTVQYMSQEDKTLLKNIREKMVEYTRPVLVAVYQKYIPLSEVPYYISNRYRDIRGFVNYLGDVKYCLKPYLWFLDGFDSLNYPGSPFTDAASTGVAVIRFRGLVEPMIPYSKEFAGREGLPYSYPTPYKGKGFTGNELAEYFYDKDPVIFEGEIYELTPSGKEILRATYGNTGWKTYEGWVVTKTNETIPAYNDVVKNGMYLKLEDRYYPAYQNDNGDYTAVSNDPKSESDGFKLSKPEMLFIRTIDGADPLADSLDYYYTFVDFSGDTLQLRGINPDGRCHLVTPDPRLAGKYQMENCDYGTYRKLESFAEIDSSRIFVIKGRLQ